MYFRVCERSRTGAIVFVAHHVRAGIGRVLHRIGQQRIQWLLPNAKTDAERGEQQHMMVMLLALLTSGFLAWN